MADAPKPPLIACLPNGPYYLIHDATPTAVPNLCRPGGGSCATARGVALCRCGGSQRKPFCDGTHGRIGFTDAKTADPAHDRRESYAGKAITIHDNRSLCAHAGHCTEALPTVFRMGREPWIDADGAPVEVIVATIAKCPSGALSYSIDGIERRDREGPPLVTVTDDGPYAVSGGIELAGASFGAGASREHYTLCRCGASRNKPFCDGSHWEAGFRDAGT